MKAMLWACRCGTGLKEPNPEHAQFVWDGEVFCSLRCIADLQTVKKCSELGITHFATTRLPRYAGAP